MVGLLVGAALGLAGAVMQGVTRNPLADPGILGVNAGAALFVVIGIYCVRHRRRCSATCGSPSSVPPSPRSSCTRSGSLGREGATPVKLALAGAALTALLGSITTAILLLDVDTLDQFRFWAVGSLAGRDGDDRRQRGAVHHRRPRDGARRPADAQRAGARRRRRPRRSASGSAWPALIWAPSASCCCAARRPRPPGRSRSSASPCPTWPGPSPGPTTAGSCRTRWCSSPILLLGADIIGRVVARPGELQVGIVTAAHRRAGLHRPRPPPEAGGAVTRRPSSRSLTGHQPRAAVRSGADGRRTAVHRSGDDPHGDGRRSVLCRRLLVRRLFCVSISVGDFPIPLRDVIPAIFGHGERPTSEFIVRTLRLPRALTGAARRRRRSGSPARSSRASPATRWPARTSSASTPGASAAAVFCIVILHVGGRCDVVARARSVGAPA